MDTKLNIFEKFVLKHEKWKTKSHISGDKSYSDYEVFYGGLIVLFILIWIYTKSFTSALFLLPVILFVLVLMKIDFVKKKKNVINAKFKEK